MYSKHIDTKKKDFHEFNVVMSFFFNIKQKIYVEIKTFFTEIEKTRKLKWDIICV